MPAVLGLADVVVVPQRSGGANVALEAMAAGRAVVAANTPDLAAVIRDGETGGSSRRATPRPPLVRCDSFLLDANGTAGSGTRLSVQVREHHSIATVVRMLETVYGEGFTSIGLGPHKQTQWRADYHIGQGTARA